MLATLTLLGGVGALFAGLALRPLHPARLRLLVLAGVVGAQYLVLPKEVKYEKPESKPKNYIDELVDANGRPRAAAKALFNWLSGIDNDELEARRAGVDAAIKTMGITFTIYSDGQNIDRAWPFDVIPRIMARSEWRGIES